MRIIDAKQAEENLRDTVRKMGFGAFILSRCIRAVRDCPTIEAEPVRHGRWIDNLDENGYLCNAWRKCSVCGVLNWSKKPNYCPNCGAKMDGDNHD